MSTSTPSAEVPVESQHNRLGGASSLVATGLEKFGLVVALAIVIVAFSIISPETFPTTDNLRNILSTNSVLAMLAVATVIPFVAGQFDLSLASVLGLSALVASVLMSKSGFPLLPAAIAGVAIGAGVGLANGLVVTRLGVSSIITTLGSSSVIAGLVLWISGGATIASGISTDLLDFGTGTWFGIPSVAYALAVIALLTGYLLRQSPYGRSLYALGDNPRAARLIGLRVDFYTTLAFVLGGALAGLAGVIQVGAAGSASPQLGPTLLLPSLTAVFLGATTIRGGEYSVLGAIVAVAFIAASTTGLTLAGAASWIEQIYVGLALIFAVAMSSVIRRRRTGQA